MGKGIANMEKITAESVFNLEANVAPLRIISMNGAQELGAKIEEHLLNWAHKCGKEEEKLSIEVDCPRFSSGDGKGLIKSSICGTDPGWGARAPLQYTIVLIY